MSRIKRFFIGLSLAIVIGAAFFGGRLSSGKKISPGTLELNQKVVTEESVVIDVAEKVSPSVVTVSITKTNSQRYFNFYDPFGFFGQPSAEEQKIEQDIGSGFIVSKDGLVITNKHVVADTQAKYKVITKDDKEYEVKNIYRDPVNDMAILKIDPSADGLKPVDMGDSDKLKVGQFVVAIGTALGEFRHTVTTGVISGLGRGIEAGSPYEGLAERLDNVIQTDAAINPGNSGGPLLNSAGQVIGVNVAVSAQGQNIGFALPINTFKKSIENFEKTGKFDRPFLGVRYRLISQNAALLNEVPQGAYIVEVVPNSPASKAGLKVGDILTKFDGQAIKEKDGSELSKMIDSKKVGDQVKVSIWRDGREKETEVNLESLSE